MSKKLYLINLSGQGDHELKLVDKITWDWINNPDMGRSENDDKGIWNDKVCPESVRLELWKEYCEDEDEIAYEDYEVDITSGSYNNDRALIAPSIKVNDEEAFFDSIKDLNEFMKKHDIEIEEEWVSPIKYLSWMMKNR